MVTAARSPLELSQVLADVTVVTREEIQRRGYGDLAHVLRATVTWPLQSSERPCGEEARERSRPGALLG